jgi:site-specific recombinase XerD
MADKADNPMSMDMESMSGDLGAASPQGSSDDRAFAGPQGTVHADDSDTHSRVSHAAHRVGKKRHRDASPVSQNGDDGSSDVVKGLDSDSSQSTQSDSDWDSDSDEEAGPSRPSSERADNHSDSEDEFARFDPLSEEHKRKWGLPKGPLKYAKRHFLNWIGEEQVKKTVLKKAPVPSDDIFHALTADADILELLGKGDQVFAKGIDNSFLRVQRKLLDTMGPLGKLWTKLEKARRQPEKPYSIHKMIDLVEKSVLLIGQTNVLAHFNRRSHILSRFLKDQKRATDLLKQNEDLLKKNKTKLFGSSFYNALYRKAKGAKHNKEIKYQLGQRASGRGGGSGAKTAGGGRGASHSRGGGQSRPFFRGPPQGNPREGHKAGPPKDRKYSSAKRGRRYVQLYYFAEANTCSPSPQKNEICTSKKRQVHVGRKHGLRRAPTTGPSARSQGSGAGGGKVSSLYKKLESDHKGRSIASVSYGARNRIRGFPSATGHQLSHAQFFAGRARNDVHGSGRASEKERGGKCHRHARPVHKSPLFEAKKGRVVQTCVQPKTTKRVREIRTFQDGKRVNALPPSPQRGLSGKNRSERRVFWGSDSRKASKIHAISMGRQNVPIQSSPVRPGNSGSYVYENAEAGHRTFAAHGNTLANLSGRHADPEPGFGKPVAGPAHGSLVTAVSGIRDKLGKIGTTTLARNRVSGFPGKLCRDDDGIARGKNCINTITMQGPVENRGDNRAHTSSAYREADSVSSGHIASPIALQTAANAKIKKSVNKQPVIRSAGNFDSGEQGGAAVVAPQFDGLERKGDYIAGPRFGNHDGRVQKRVGGGMPGNYHPGPVEPGRERAAYKCAGNDRGGIRDKSVHAGKERETCALESGQQSRDGANKQNGWHPIEDAAESNTIYVEILSIPGNVDNGGALTGQIECNRGSRVARFQGREQLEAVTRDVRSIGENDGTDKYRFVCGSIERAEKSVRKLEGGSAGGCDGRVQSGVAGKKCVRFSAIQHDRQMPSKSAERASNADLGYTCMAGATVVSASVGDDNSGSNSVPAAPKIAHIPNGGAAPSNDSERPEVSGVESLRRRVEAGGLSKRAAEIVVRARRGGTQTAYNVAWNKWLSWCDQGKIDPSQASLGNIADFLSSRFDEGLEYATMNSYRSALSAFHPEIGGFPVGKHPTITALLRGMFNERPPKPRYSQTWDVDDVLRYIKAEQQDTNLSLKDLTLKLTMLLALCSASRGSELQRLNPQSMVDMGNQIEFHVEGLTKTSRPGKPHMVVRLDDSGLDSHLNVLTCLREYLSRTKAFRTDASRESQLLISYTKPHWVVQRCTVARWLKTLMSKAGIDTSHYKAHSTRMAGTSKARAQGVTTEQIMQKANWSKATTFRIFYHREVSTKPCEFQNKVLEL